MSKWITLKLKTITPCFIGGASNGIEDNLTEEIVRPASYIGQWRFWLRAWLGAQYTEDNALQKIQTREALLFGTSQNLENLGQGMVQVKPSQFNETIKIHEKNLNFNDKISDKKSLAYLAYGLFELRKINENKTHPFIIRDAVKANQTIQLKIMIRPPHNTQSEYWSDLRYTLIKSFFLNI